MRIYRGDLILIGHQTERRRSTRLVATLLPRMRVCENSTHAYANARCGVVTDALDKVRRVRALIRVTLCGVFACVEHTSEGFVHFYCVLLVHKRLMCQSVCLQRSLMDNTITLYSFALISQHQTQTNKQTQPANQPMKGSSSGAVFCMASGRLCWCLCLAPACRPQKWSACLCSFAPLNFRTHINRLRALHITRN